MPVRYELDVNVARKNHFVGLGLTIDATREMTKVELELAVVQLWAVDPDEELPGYEVFSVHVRDRVDLPLSDP